MGLTAFGDQMSVEVRVERIRKREKSESVPRYQAWGTEEKEQC